MTGRGAGYGRPAIAAGAARWLTLAAAPLFAVMAAMTVIRGESIAIVLCSGPQGGSLLDGMAPMYVLMSIVHLAPWIRLAVRPGARLPPTVDRVGQTRRLRVRTSAR